MNITILKKIIKAGTKFVFNPRYRFLVLADMGLYNNVSDGEYLKRRYDAFMRKKLNLEEPCTFNEKMQWLKLYDRKSIYTLLVDKVKVKDYVADKIGSEYVIPTLGVWDKPEDIQFEKLPKRFVLKCNHNSGLGMYICNDRTLINEKRVKRNLRKGLKQDYYLSSREWPYKDVPRKIIAEENIAIGTEELKDYKFMCFNGRVKCSFVCSDRFSGDGLKVTFFDREWNVMPFERCYPKSNVQIAKPNNYDKMIELAEKLAKDIPFVRVDFYDLDDRIYFGELTFYPGSGFEEFRPEKWDWELGSWINLPNK